MRRLFWFVLAVGLGFAAWNARTRFGSPAPGSIAAPPNEAARAPDPPTNAKGRPVRPLPSADIDDESRRELDRILREADTDEAQRP